MKKLLFIIFAIITAVAGVVTVKVAQSKGLSSPLIRKIISGCR